MNRLLVILDLDETLVHVPDYPLARRADFEVLGHAGYRRPFLDEFLGQLRGRYDVAVWTAAGRDYAQAVVSTIIPWWTEQIVPQIDYLTPNLQRLERLDSSALAGHRASHV